MRYPEQIDQNIVRPERNHRDQAERDAELAPELGDQQKQDAKARIENIITAARYKVHNGRRRLAAHKIEDARGAALEFNNKIVFQQKGEEKKQSRADDRPDQIFRSVHKPFPITRLCFIISQNDSFFQSYEIYFSVFLFVHNNLTDLTYIYYRIVETERKEGFRKL